MTRIDDSGRLAALIRRQMATLRQGTTGTRRAGERRSASTAQAPLDLAALLAQRMDAIDPADPAGQHQAMRAFLEGALLQELGPELINDPAFHALVSEVHEQMQSNPDLARSMQEASAHMLDLTQGR